MADPTFLDAGDPGMGDFDDEAPPACVLALCLQRDKLGLASFDEATGIMSVGQTHASQSSLLDTIESLKMVGSPTLMLISQQMARNEELMHLIESPLLEGGQKFEIQALKPRFWEYDRARNTVTAHLHVKDLYQLKGLPRNETDAFQMLDSVLDWTAKQSIQALGALVSHLQVTTFSMEADRSVMVLRVEEMSWLKRMRVDPVSLRALGIFCEEQHPNVLRGKGRSKEGFSLFSLLDRTRSIPGRKQLRDWMMAPSTDIKVITARQDGVELFLAPENAELCNHIAAQLSRIQDIPRILLRIKRVSVRPVHWLSLASSLEAALAVRDILDVLRQRAHSLASSKFVETIMHGMNPQDLVHASRELSTVIDFEASRIEGDIVIRSGVDDELDRLKSTFAELPSTLQTVGSVLLADYPHVPELSVEYLPQIGFLVAMPYSFDAYAPSDFSLSFRQDQTAFYKCPRTDDLDQTIGDIRAHIADRQQSLMRSLEDNILFREIALQLGAMALAELDALMSLACAARDLRMVRPRVVEANHIFIDGGRHPLQELVVDQFIPNDTFLGGARGTMGLITGGNFSGKSVYLKQVGVLVFLAHIGSFLPCQRAIIGITDRIFTRISTIESCALPQSSFTIDLGQVAKMLHHATSRSLLLIDEFGKGTNATDGVALLAALIKKLAIPPSPKVLITLHFLEIFRQGLLGNAMDEASPGSCGLPGVMAFCMEMHISNDEGGKPVPLFKLKPGVAKSSHGIACAKEGGLDEAVLQRAKELLPLVEAGQPLTLRNDALPPLQHPAVLQALGAFLARAAAPEGATWTSASEEDVEEMYNLVQAIPHVDRIRRKERNGEHSGDAAPLG